MTSENVTHPMQYGTHLTSVLAYLNQYRFISCDRLKQLTKDVFGSEISKGTLVNMAKRINGLLESTEASINEKLLTQSSLLR